MRLRMIAALLLLGFFASAAPKRVLYLTATYGYRHIDAIETSVEVFRQIAQETGTLEIVHTEDLSWISAARLRDFDAVYFFTSGELPLTDSQKADLLAFVRDGKGFGGSHSATDTLYTWPEYGSLIGGIFDGHPWVREATVNVEQPDHPIVAHAAPSFRAEEEFYQFRSFSRQDVRVLLSLDTRGLNPPAEDVPLVWVRDYGRGRVFYSAFGHFPVSFQSPPLRTMLRQALLWLTGQPVNGMTTSGRRGGSPLRVIRAAPVIVAGRRVGGVVILHAVGLGDAPAAVTVGGRPAAVTHCSAGVCQITAIVPAGTVEVSLEVDGVSSPAFRFGGR